jgi:hypothetical protein
MKVFLGSTGYSNIALNQLCIHPVIAFPLFTEAKADG